MEKQKKALLQGNDSGYFANRTKIPTSKKFEDPILKE